MYARRRSLYIIIVTFFFLFFRILSLLSLSLSHSLSLTLVYTHTRIYVYILDLTSKFHPGDQRNARRRRLRIRSFDICYYTTIVYIYVYTCTIYCIRLCSRGEIGVVVRRVRRSYILLAFFTRPPGQRICRHSCR